jgi:hypothetical protein
MMALASGTLETSGIKFVVLVSGPVDVDDVALIATLLRRGAIKAENIHHAPPSEVQP